MRTDRLTTKFQQALADAQSAALANDSGFIEPQHLLLALLNQEDGGSASLLQRAGANVPGLLAGAEAAVKRLPQVQGQEQVQVGRDMITLLPWQAAPGETATPSNAFITAGASNPSKLMFQVFGSFFSGWPFR